MQGWFGTTNEHEWTRIDAARAFQTRGTKVGWEWQNNLLRLKDSVFFQYSGAQLTRAKAQATVFVPRVFPARDLLMGFPEHDRRYGGGEGDFSSQFSVLSSQFSVFSFQAVHGPRSTVHGPQSTVHSPRSTHFTDVGCVDSWRV